VEGGVFRSGFTVTLVSLNKGTEAELAALVGAPQAAIIVRERTNRGGFITIDEIGSIQGITKATMATLRQETVLNNEA
ncbi:MAG TPA: helix-hairpin-helix domain-containing protein, partial [Thermoanaerobaculia bacterium]